MYYSYNNQYPIPANQLPTTISLADGTVLTNTGTSLFDDADLERAGWKKVPNPPDYDSSKTRLTWDIIPDTIEVEYGWVVRGLTFEEKATEVRSLRNTLMNNFMWKIYRNQREKMLGLPTTDNIIELDTYMQALADITKQESFPWSVEWPIPPGALKGASEPSQGQNE